MTQFKAGDKVKIPTRKTFDTYTSLHSSRAIEQAKKLKRDFLYVYDIRKSISSGEEYIVLTTDLTTGMSNFSPSDLELYEEPRKFKKGDKVVPHDKTVENYGGLSVSGMWKTAQRKGQNYLYVIEYIEQHKTNPHLKDYYKCNHNTDDDGDFFKESDLTLYVEKQEEKAPEIVYTREYLASHPIIVQVANKEEEIELIRLNLLESSARSFTPSFDYRLYTQYGYASTGWYLHKHEYKDYTTIPASTIINSHKKQQKTDMKSLPFAIYGKTSLLNAIEEDLVAIGYTKASLGSGGGVVALATNWTKAVDKKQERQSLYLGSVNSRDWYRDQGIKIFDLPKDYEAALAFAKEQLDDKNFVPEFKVGDIVFVVRNNSAGHDSGTVANVTSTTKNSSGHTIVRLQTGNSYELGHLSTDLRLATAEEIATFNKPKSETLVVGSNSVTITIYKDKVDAKGENLSIASLKTYKNKFSTEGVGLGGHNAYIDPSVRFIRIGCKTENNLVSLNEIDAVLNRAAKL